MTSAARAAFTLSEMLVAGALSSMVLAGVVFACLSLRRSFEAANYHMTAQTDQLRVLDYLAHDLRSVSSLAILDGGMKLEGSLQVSDSTPVGLRLGAPLLNLLSAPEESAVVKPLTYVLEGGQLIRNLGGTETVLADTVTHFQTRREGPMAVVEIEFSPRFSRSAVASRQAATRLTSRIFMRNSASD